MSNLHAYADDFVAPNAVTAGGIVAAIGTAATAAVASVWAVVERRRALRHIARLPDHLLRDFGYERDWDGTVRPLGDEA
jgi:hypothetical protein